MNFNAGKNFKIGLAALGTAIVAIPLAAAYAMPTEALEQEAAEAAAAEAAAGPSAEQVAQGRELFNSWSCSACHQLTDANAHGHIGPSLDGNTNIDHDFIVNRVTNGQGAMPGFGGQLTDEEIDVIASYIVAVKQ